MIRIRILNGEVLIEMVPIPREMGETIRPFTALVSLCINRRDESSRLAGATARHMRITGCQLSKKRCRGC